VRDLADVDSALDRLVASNLLIGTLVLAVMGPGWCFARTASASGPLVEMERTAAAHRRR